MSMSKIHMGVNRLDTFQQKHRATAFIFAVIKKYGDDEAGKHAALLTYYSFLSLFPLLLLLTTIVDVLIGKDAHLRATIINGLTNYFPLLGSQLSSHVHRLNASGVALITGILFTLYGTRGVAEAFRNGVDTIWLIPKSKRDSFPKSALKSIALIVVGGLGFILASIVASLASSAGHGLGFRAVSLAVNLFILFWLFIFIINFSLPKHVTIKETRLGAAVAAIALLVLQTLGSYLLIHQLKRLDALYSYFAVALGLLFWIYLQAQIIYYSIEISVVNSKKLWPRSLNNSNKTKADNIISSAIK